MARSIDETLGTHVHETDLMGAKISIAVIAVMFAVMLLLFVLGPSTLNQLLIMYKLRLGYLTIVVYSCIACN